MSHSLIAFRQQGVAHLLANYLCSQKLPARVLPTEAGDEFVVVLQNDSDALQARAITEQFLKDPNNPKYQQAAWQHGENVHLTTNTQGLDTKAVLGAIMAVPFTSSVLLICIGVYLLSLFGLFSSIAQHLLMQPLRVLATNHEWWRLLGPAFIHFSALHIIFNVLWWWMLGAKIERTLGKSMLIVVFLISAVVSNVAQSMVSEPVPGNLLLFGGLSGVVYAVMGFVWWLGWLKPQWGVALPKSIVGFMLVWLVLGYADILWVNMASAAHTAGLITGCLLAAILSLGVDKNKPRVG